MAGGALAPAAAQRRGSAAQAPAWRGLLAGLLGPAAAPLRPWGPAATPLPPCPAGNSGSRRDAEEILYHLLPKGITVFAFDFAVSGSWGVVGAVGAMGGGQVHHLCGRNAPTPAFSERAACPAHGRRAARAACLQPPA